MKTEIAHHIAHLLLENDCVIVPQLGGFVAHYVSSKFNETEQLYMPPRREIAFNPQLKLNDGLLAQSYMTAYGMSFPEATKEIAHQVKLLTKQIHHDGMFDLPNIGQLRFTMNQKYLFIPYTEVLTSPSLYGLSSFHLDTLEGIEKKRQLAALEATLTPLVTATKTKPVDTQDSKQDKEEKTRVADLEPISKETSFKFGQLVKLVNTPMRIVATAAAAILLFLVLSKPVGNTSTNGSNYAEIIPMNLFEQVIPQTEQINPSDSVASSVIKAAVVTVKSPSVNTVAHKTAAAKPSTAQHQPVAVAKSAKSYYLIVASCKSQEDADRESVRIGKSIGKKLTCVVRNGKYRLSAGEYTNRTDASTALTQLREIPDMQSSWMLIIRN